MFAAFIRFLITILLIALCVVLLIWVLGIVGIHFPPMVINIVYAIAVLVVLLMAYKFFSPYWGDWFRSP